MIEGKPVVDQKAKELELARAETRKIEEELKRLQYDRVKDDSTQREIERIQQKYDRLRQENRSAVRRIKMLWQASSGGKYVATAEKKESDTQKAILGASNAALSEFSAKFIEEPVMRDIWDIRRHVSELTAELRAEELAKDGVQDKIGGVRKAMDVVNKATAQALAETKARHEKKISDFDGVLPKSIAVWIKMNKAHELIKRADTRPHEDPALPARILSELRSRPGEYMTYDLGPADANAKGGRQPDTETLELAERFKNTILGQYRNERERDLTGINDRKEHEIREASKADQRF